MLTKNAFNNMRNRYKAALNKCRLLNTFGSLAMAGLMAATLLCAPAYASMPDVTVTTDEYTESNKDSYYMTYTVPVYDADTGTYTSTNYGVYLKGGTTSYTDISALTDGLILGTTAYNGGFTSISTQDSGDYSLTINGVTYYLDEVTATSSRKTSLTDNVNEDFIGAYHSSGLDGQGGAIYNTSTTDYTITGAFFGNYTSGESAFGGAIYNTGKLGTICGSFIGNRANANYSTSRGGAICNYGTIGDITASFIWNYASGSTKAYGGAIYNSGTIGDITGSFIGNYASGINTYGGAIYNSGTIGTISASFIGNYASGNSSVYGGAIYNYSTSDTTGNLTFLANDAIYLFTDNYTLSGSTKDYNFITSKGGTLTFTMSGTGGYILNDSIVSDSTAYTMTITGDATSEADVFYLNAGISGVSTFSISDASLYMGSYLHADGTTRTYGSISASSSLSLGNLVADVAYYNGALLQGNGTATLTVADGSSLILTNASANTYTIAENFVTGSTVWSTDNVSVVNSLLETLVVSGDAMTEAYTVTVGVKSASAATGASIYNTPMAALLYATASSGLYDADSSNAGARFIYETMENTSLSDEQKIQVLEGAAQIASVSGVQAQTATVISSANSVVDTRMLNANATNPSSTAMRIVDEDGQVFVYNNITELAANDVGDLVSDGGAGLLSSPKDYTEIWFMPMYAHETVSGLSSGNFSKTGYSSDMYGVALGIDRTFQDSYRIGLAFDMGFGDAQSSGDYVRTTNDYDFFGLMAYGAMRFDNLSIMGSAGYTKNASDVAQDLSAYGQSNLYANVDSNAWNFSLKAEYTCALGEGLSLAPYAGVQYMMMSTDGYSVNNANNLGTGTYGATVFNIASDSQNVWTFPLGVTLSKEYHSANGWDYTPKMNVGAIFATGDLHATSVTTIPDIDASSTMSLQVIDDATLDLGLGVGASKGDVVLMLDYDFQYSEHRTAHGLTAKVMWAF